MTDEHFDKFLNSLDKLAGEIRDIRTNMAFSKDVYTNQEFMKLFDISSATAKKWRDSGLLGYSQIGDTYLYRKVDIEEFLLAIHHSPYAARRSIKGRG